MNQSLLSGTIENFPTLKSRVRKRKGAGNSHDVVDDSKSNDTIKTNEVQRNDEKTHINNAKRITSQENDDVDDQGGPILLIICASGICICYVVYGMIQEQVLSKDGNVMQEAGSITTFMLLLQCLTNMVVAMVLMVLQSKWKGDGGGEIGEHSTSQSSSRYMLNHPLLVATAFCYFTAMTATNESLAHVSYPTAVLAKSTKLIGVMIVGFVLERRSFSHQEWFSASLITLGIVIFNLSRMNMIGNNHGSNTSNDDDTPKQEDSLYGLGLLAYSLFMDGLLATCQNRLKQGNKMADNATTSSKGGSQRMYRPPTAFETMLWSNAYASVFYVPLSIYTGQFSNGMSLLFPTVPPIPSGTNKALSARRTIAILNIAAAIGQIFIFITIQLFSPIMCTTITTTRKFITILLSVWSYGHSYTHIQWGCIFLVFGGLYLGIMFKVQVARSKSAKKNI